MLKGVAFCRWSSALAVALQLAGTSLFLGLACRDRVYFCLSLNLSVLLHQTRLLKSSSAMLAYFLEAVDIAVQVENEVYHI